MQTSAIHTPGKINPAIPAGIAQPQQTSLPQHPGQVAAPAGDLSSVVILGYN